MPGFKIHISVSTGCGIALGTATWVAGVPFVDSVLAGTFCSIGGILPDMDSASGRPSREVFGLLGATVPMMMAQRMTESHWPHDLLVLTAIIAYVAIRFGMARILSRIAVHRGMWHSLPAAASAAIVMFLLSECPEFNMRLLRAFAVLVGFMSHLIMDEIWSIDLRNKPHIKKSFGTALKLWSTKYKTATAFVYILLLSLIFVADKQTNSYLGKYVAENWPAAQQWLATTTERFGTTANGGIPAGSDIEQRQLTKSGPHRENNPFELPRATTTPTPPQQHATFPPPLGFEEQTASPNADWQPFQHSTPAKTAPPPNVEPNRSTGLFAPPARTSAPASGPTSPFQPW